MKNGYIGWGITTLNIGGSSVSGPFGAVRYACSTPVEDERSSDLESFGGAPGLICRPRPASAARGVDGTSHDGVGCESVGVRLGESIVPVAYRDLRLNLHFPAPKEGTTALVGYGGGYVSFDDDSAGENSIATIYVPYQRDNDGNPQKCHCIVLDPEKETVAIIHGDGMAIIMGADGSITTRADENTMTILSPGAFTVIATSIALRGNVVVGANPVGAVPLTPGVSCPSLFLSSV